MSTSYTTRTSVTTTFTDRGAIEFLLQESLSFLLLETGDRILLDQSIITTYTERTTI